MRIELDKIQERALKGARRAYVFMGLGVNAALDERLNDYQLTHITSIQLLKDGLEQDTVTQFKEAYCEWTINSSLRELLESFQFFIEEVYLCLIMIKKNAASPLHVKPDVRRFDKKPFPSKLAYLNEQFSIPIESLESLRSINRARNCITHRGSVVTRRDCNDQEKEHLYVTWMGLCAVLIDENGEQEIEFNELKGHQIENECRIGVKKVERQKRFGIGQPVKFEPTELAEMLLFWSREITGITKGVADFAESKGRLVQNEG